MPSADETKQSITNWCSSDDDLEITSDRFEAGTDFSFGLKAGVLSSSPVELVVLKGDGADRVTIRRSMTLSGDNVSAANQLISSRPGSVTAAVERSGGDTSVVAQTYVYLDGLSKHTFVQAVAELARTSTLLDGISSEVAQADEDTVLADMPADGTVDTETATTSEATSPASTPAWQTPVTAFPSETVQQPTTPQPSSIPAGQPLPQPSFTPQPAQPVQAQQAYSPQPAQQPYQAQPVQAQPVQQPAAASQWVPSHSVPPQGLRAWGAPDPAGPVVANLAPGLPIQVAEVRGAWARVICSNGWTGWIDGRIIGVAA
jgi:Bacterial SH3 domain